MAEFLTVNLKDILNNQKSFDDYTATEQKKSSTSTSTPRNLSRISDWSKELKDRLTENGKLEANIRKSDYEVELQFFEDYFTYGETWNGSYTEELLSLGDPLKKAIKVLGFDKNVNPILGFILDDTVLRNLLQTKLLNVNTFKAIYNAVSKKLVADSEFFNANDYNIIFCQDLYRRPAAEIIKYLTVQKSILSPSASAYTKADQERNKKTFFELTDIDTLDAIKKRYPEESSERYARLKAAIENLPTGTELPPANNTATKLNNLSLASFLAGDNSGVAVDEEESQSNTKPDTTRYLAKKLSANSAQAFVALQYLNATTNTPEVAKALKHEAFKNLSIEALMGVSASVMKAMKEAKLSGNDVKQFIDVLISGLERTV